MKEQIWFCKSCGKRGLVHYEPSEDVWSVVQKVYKAHAQASSGECDFGSVKVVNLSEITNVELEEVYKLEKA